MEDATRVRCRAGRERGELRDRRARRTSGQTSKPVAASAQIEVVTVRLPTMNETELEQIQLGLRLSGIFTPYFRSRRDSMYDSGAKESVRFVHYTSPEAALKRAWMRNATCMTDYRELQHGFAILHRFFADEERKKRFHAVLDAVSPNIAAEALNLFNQWWMNDIQLSTYVTSISEHDDREDLHRRLSMWRAFGGQTARVAIVLRIPWYSAALQALSLIIGPVAYLPEEDAPQAIMENVIANLRENDNVQFLRSLDRQMVVGAVFNMLVEAVTCLKHEGFQEEREW